MNKTITRSQEFEENDKKNTVTTRKNKRIQLQEEHDKINHKKKRKVRKQTIIRRKRNRIMNYEKKAVYLEQEEKNENKVDTRKGKKFNFT